MRGTKDEDLIEEINRMVEQDEFLLDRFAYIIAEMFEHASTPMLEFFQQQSAWFSTWVSPGQPEYHRFVAVKVICAVVRAVGAQAATEEFYNNYLQHVFAAIEPANLSLPEEQQTHSHVVRPPAIECLTDCCQYGGEAFMSLCTGKLPDLLQICVEPPDTTDQNELAQEYDGIVDDGRYSRDAAVLAIVRIMEAYGSHIPSQQREELVSTILRVDPVECCVDNDAVYKFFVDGVNNNVAEVVGPNGSNFIPIAVMLTHAIAEEDVIEEEEVEDKMAKCVQNMLSTMSEDKQRNTMETKFTEKQRNCLRRKLQGQ